MIKFRKSINIVYATVLAVGVATAHDGNASSLVVSGDTTIFSNAGPSNDNERFLSNLLGSGSNILFQDGASAFFNGVIPALLAGIGTVTQVNSTVELSPGDFAGQDLFVSARPTDLFSNSEAMAVDGFLNSGGSVLLSGEFTEFEAQNPFINALLQDLGSSMSLDPGTAVDNPGSEFANIAVNNDLTSGVTVFEYGYSASLTGGETLFTSAVTRSSIIAFESYGEMPQVPLPATLPLAAAGFATLFAFSRRRI